MGIRRFAAAANTLRRVFPTNNTNTMTQIHLTVRAVLAAAFIAAIAPAAGADVSPASDSAPAAADADSGDSLESVIVTGTRETNVKARDSVAPIDVLPATALQAT